ncbi:hypothetical protein SAMN02799631_03369 [Methylobacterium sp. 174MFSha1.1]|uniref:hypothetical protein n=1 Tax=Methylobacterium sp. 174MFSha1.1 TaxID=1502749 RepID=UPI0008F11B22|nr:hypothetical protein [Methylobacterium sp. 174MFSha1.1]SFU94961.1 hypothetical protein SAMN02799631_03369 [Methylobacterium sp. 174MFSha1.1]
MPAFPALSPVAARTAILLAILPACLSAGGCVLDGAGIRDAAKSAGFGPKEVAAPDFVKETRRGGGEFLPVGVSAPPRETRAKSAAGVKQLEAELDASRQRNEAKGRDAAKVGGAVKPPAPPKVPPAE